MNFCLLKSVDAVKGNKKTEKVKNDIAKIWQMIKENQKKVHWKKRIEIKADSGLANGRP